MNHVAFFVDRRYLVAYFICSTNNAISWLFCTCAQQTNCFYMIHFFFAISRGERSIVPFHRSTYTARYFYFILPSLLSSHPKTTFINFLWKIIKWKKVSFFRLMPSIHFIYKILLFVRVNVCAAVVPVFSYKFCDQVNTTKAFSHFIPFFAVHFVQFRWMRLWCGELWLRFTE